MTALRICPHCQVLLRLNTFDAPYGQCSRCGSRYRRKIVHRHAIAARIAGPVTSIAAITQDKIDNNWSEIPYAPPMLKVAARRRRSSRHLWQLTGLIIIFAGMCVGALKWSVIEGGTEAASLESGSDAVPANPQAKESRLVPSQAALPKAVAADVQPKAVSKRSPTAEVLPGSGHHLFQIPASGNLPESPRLAGSRRIDELVMTTLREKDIAPAALCSDSVFVRRVYLDLIGTLPTLDETRSFLKDSRSDKRAVLIDQLLDRPEYADYWAMKWGDLLRIKSEFPINLWPNASRAYHRWVHNSLHENRPYDDFVRQLLTAGGSNFRSPEVNFYRAVQGRDAKNISRAVALTFMGVRPEGMTTEQWAGLEVLFSRIGYKPTKEWKEEIVFFDSTLGPLPSEASFPNGVRAAIPPGQDPRHVFANWFIQPDNPWFARNVVNRVWYWLLGRGIIHEPDDIRPGNPPSHPELLAHLEKEFIQGRYDLKLLFRIILNSRTYQLSCIPASQHPDAAALFAYYPLRRLDAEVLIDAICQITGATEKYSSPIPEPFTYLPRGHRAINIPDGSISSPFLEMFGRPPRDTGLESERNNAITAAQRLHLLNSAHIQRAIENGPRLSAMIASTKSPRELADNVYLHVLSRYPTDEELSRIGDFTKSNGRGRRPAVDIVWALINSAEFLYRH